MTNTRWRSCAISVSRKEKKCGRSLQSHAADGIYSSFTNAIQTTVQKQITMCLHSCRNVDRTAVSTDPLPNLAIDSLVPPTQPCRCRESKVSMGPAWHCRRLGSIELGILPDPCVAFPDDFSLLRVHRWSSAVRLRCSPSSSSTPELPVDFSNVAFRTCEDPRQTSSRASVDDPWPTSEATFVDDEYESDRIRRRTTFAWNPPLMSNRTSRERERWTVRPTCSSLHTCLDCIGRILRGVCSVDIISYVVSSSDLARD